MYSSHSYMIDGRGGEILAGLTFSLFRWFIIFVCCRPPLYPPPPPNVTKLTRPPSPLLAPPASIPCTRVEGGLARYHGSHFTPQLLSFLILKRERKYFDFFGDQSYHNWTKLNGTCFDIFTFRREPGSLACFLLLCILCLIWDMMLMICLQS